MAETLTESFCESCGTRYEFAAPTRLSTARKTRGLLGGIKNYLTGGEGLGEAIGDAIRSEEEVLAAAQLDAFHQTFSFCISCRQYTCNNCWNTDAGRCRNCAPIPGLTGFAAGADAIAASPVDVGAPGIGSAPADEYWPAVDQPVTAAAEPPLEWPAADDLPGAPAEWAAWSSPDALAGAAPSPSPEMPEQVAEPVRAEELPWESATAEPVEAVDVDEALEVAEAAPQPEEEVEVEPLPRAPRPTHPLRLAIWEAGAATGEAAAAPDAGVPTAAETEPEALPTAPPAEPRRPLEILPVSETRPRPTEPAGPVVRPMPAAPRPVPPPVAQPQEREPVAASGETDVAARRAQLDILGLEDPGEGALGRERPNVLPYRSRGASAHPVELAQRAGLAGGFWDASARQVAGSGGGIAVQACGACGLSLSATARFCRRCGTRQARSA